MADAVYKFKGEASWGIKALSFIAIALIAFPVLAITARAVQNQGWQSLNQARLVSAVSISLITTVVSTCITFVFGLPLAYFFARSQFRFKNFLTVLVELPIILPPTVAGLALLMAAGRRGLLGGILESMGISLPFTTSAVVIAQIFVSAPFFIRAAQAGFQAIPEELEEAALIDGATPSQIFRHVTFPLASIAIATGLTLSWARSPGEFGATLLFAGNLVGQTQTLTLFIYNSLESDINAATMASVILLGIAFITLLFSKSLSRMSQIY